MFSTTLYQKFQGHWKLVKNFGCHGSWKSQWLKFYTKDRPLASKNIKFEKNRLKPRDLGVFFQKLEKITKLTQRPK